MKITPTNIICLCLLFLLAPTTAHATSDLQVILDNVQKLIDPFFWLLNAAAMLLGIGFIFRGLSMLQAMGTALTHSSKPGELTGPLVYIAVGTILMYLPYTSNIASNSFFGIGGDSVQLSDGLNSFKDSMRLGSDFVGYTKGGGVEGEWADILDTIVYYINFIGYLAFVRGWVILAHIGQPGSQPGTIPKALTHIIGGVLAINFLPLLDVLNNTIFEK